MPGKFGSSLIVIHDCEGATTLLKSWRSSSSGICPRHWPFMHVPPMPHWRLKVHGSDAPTTTSHCASSSPLGKLMLTNPVSAEVGDGCCSTSHIAVWSNGMSL